MPNKQDQAAYIRQLINSLYGGLRALNKVTDALGEVGFQDIKIFSEIAGYKTITASKPSV